MIIKDYKFGQVNIKVCFTGQYKVVEKNNKLEYKHVSPAYSVKQFEKDIGAI